MHIHKYYIYIYSSFLIKNVRLKTEIYIYILKAGVQHPLEVLLVLYSRKLLCRLYPHQILHVQRYSTQGNYCADWLYSHQILHVQRYSIQGNYCTDRILIRYYMYGCCIKWNWCTDCILIRSYRYSIQWNYFIDRILIKSCMYKGTVLNETGIQIVSSSDTTCTKVQYSRKLLYRLYPH